MTFTVPSLSTDSETALLLPGDIHVKDRAFSSGWLKELSSRFAYVLYVPGNHEHYTSSIDVTSKKINAAIQNQGLTNVICLDNQVFEIPDSNIVVLGGTMWTDYHKGNPVSQWTAQQIMLDFKKIRVHNYMKKLKPNDLIIEHLKFKSFLVQELQKYSDKTVIVMSHHAPHMLSIDPIYNNSKDYMLNGAYASDLSDLILDHPQIKYWFHGHMHNNSHYQIGDCTVIANPRGYYPDQLNPSFDPEFVIKL